MSEGLLTSAGPPRVPTSISPSRYGVLEECPLRYAWEAGGEPPRLPPSPASRLGTAIHNLFARAEGGRLPPSEDAVRGAWSDEIAAAEAKMRESWLERAFVPLRRSVSHYEESRRAAIRKALRLARQAPAVPTIPVDPPGENAEAGLPTAAGKIRGKHDVALRTPEGVIIRDHKTGRAYEEDEATNSRIVKRGYALQLQLYAALHASARGEWPVRLEVETLQGEVIEVPFSPAQCEALLKEAASRLDELRLQVTEVQQGRQPVTILARPAEEVCRLCPYRPICPGYRPWKESQPDGGSGWMTDLWGALQEICPGRRDLAVLNLETGTGNRQILDVANSPQRNPALGQLRPGDQVAAFNLGRSGTSEALLATDFTVVYKVPS